MVTSSETKQINGAMVAFHKEVRKVGKDAKNPFFKSKYASLSNILDTIDEPLVNNGLAIVQFPEGEYGLTTRLIHVSGEWMEGHYEMKPVKDTPQDRGSAITYARRYAIAAILSLNVDDDDDANQASGRSAVGKELPVHQAPKQPTREEKQLLVNKLEASTLEGMDKAKALEAIGECTDYKTYQKLEHRLDELKRPFDQIQNPSQKDIANHTRKIANV